MMILAARFLDVIISNFKKKASFLMPIILITVIVFPTFADSLKFVSIINSSDTRILAKEWIENNIPPGARIAEEGYISKIPSRCPPICEDREALERDYAEILSSGGSGFLTKMKIKNFGTINACNKTYNIFKANRLSAVDLDSARASYVILTGDNDTCIGKEMSYYVEAYLGKDYFEKRNLLKDRIFEQYAPAKSFHPTYEFTPYFPLLMNDDYGIIRKISWRELKNFVKGPKITIFKKKE